MNQNNSREGKPDFHMMALAKSECAKDAGEMTVVRLGYVTQLLEALYETHHQELQKARKDEVERMLALAEDVEIFTAFGYDTSTVKMIDPAKIINDKTNGL
jgi:hypothetical protein